MSADREFWSNYDRYRHNTLKGLSKDLQAESIEQLRDYVAQVTSRAGVLLMENTKMLKVMTDFINEREEFIETLKQCVNADADYHRWQGHAEARRVLAERIKELSTAE